MCTLVENFRVNQCRYKTCLQLLKHSAEVNKQLIRNRFYIHVRTCAYCSWGLSQERVGIFLIVLHDMAVRCVTYADFCVIELEYRLGHVCSCLLSLVFALYCVVWAPCDRLIPSLKIVLYFTTCSKYQWFIFGNISYRDKTLEISLFPPGELCPQDNIHADFFYLRMRNELTEGWENFTMRTYAICFAH
jgi:hypothetical protein